MAYCKISLKKLSDKPPRSGALALYNPREFKKLFGSTKVKPRLPFSRSELFQDSRKKVQGMSISGVQQKLSLVENEKHELVATALGGSYVLKPSPEAYPYAAENEHAAMLISQLMDIDTALCGLVSFSDEELAYITKRFDRLDDGSKLHQEDLMQCFGLPSDDKYSKTYEAAGQLLDEVANGKQAVVLDFVRRVILTYVIGNDDLHLKNFSVLRLPDNTTRFYDKLTPNYYDKLTPNYDCLFCEASKSDDEQDTGVNYLALGLLKEKDSDDEFFSEKYEHYGYYTGYDFLELGKRLGLSEKPIRNFIAKLKSRQKKIEELIKHSYMPDDMKLRTIKLVKDRIRVIQCFE